MATEGPLIHDGSQCVATSNYGKGVVGLAGPGSSGQFLAVYINASRSVGICATAGAEAYGILQNDPPSGAAADVGILGVTKAVAGSNAITAGGNLATDASGRLVAATGTQNVIAVAIEASSATNQIITVSIVPNSKGGY